MAGKAVDEAVVDEVWPEKRTFEVLVSFSGLDKGERFSQDEAAGLAWARLFVENGYLRDVTEGDSGAGRGEVGQG